MNYIKDFLYNLFGFFEIRGCDFYFFDKAVAACKTNICAINFNIVVFPDQKRLQDELKLIGFKDLLFVFGKFVFKGSGGSVFQKQDFINNSFYMAFF